MKYWLILVGIFLGQFMVGIIPYLYYDSRIGESLSSQIFYACFSLPVLFLAGRSQDKDLSGCAKAFFLFWILGCLTSLFGPPAIFVLITICAIITYAAYKQLSLSILSIIILICLLLEYAGAVSGLFSRNTANLLWVLQSTLLLGQWLSIHLSEPRYRIPIPDWLYYQMTGLDVRRKLQKP